MIDMQHGYLTLMRDSAADSPRRDWAHRQVLMRLCALANEKELSLAVQQVSPFPEVRDVRAAETGLVMVRGRTGGDGQPFNFGEVTVSRATIALPDGILGFGYVLGRSTAKARLAAIIDALGQTQTHGARIRQEIEASTGERVVRERRVRAAEVLATRVDFFTMQRGED